MAPPLKISRESVIEGGYRLILSDGLENLNCRNIAKLLGCSTQPVFSRFPNMEELKRAVFVYACEKLETSIAESSAEDSCFRSAYTKLFHLAREEKNIFRLIFLSTNHREATFLKERLSYRTNQRILDEFMEKYQLDREKAEDLLERLSLFIHGIAVVLATTTMDYSDEKIHEMVEKTIKDMAG